MKVTAWKTVEVECECDVEIEQVLQEFAQRVDESSKNYYRRLVPCIDWMTRMLAKIGDETIEAMPDSARIEVTKRLSAEAERYAIKVARNNP